MRIAPRLPFRIEPNKELKKLLWLFFWGGLLKVAEVKLGEILMPSQPTPVPGMSPEDNAPSMNVPNE